MRRDRRVVLYCYGLSGGPPLLSTQLFLEGGELSLLCPGAPGSPRAGLEFPTAGSDFQNQPDLRRELIECFSPPRKAFRFGALHLDSSVPGVPLCPFLPLLRLAHSLHDYSNPLPPGPKPSLKPTSLSERHALCPLPSALCPWPGVLSHVSRQWPKSCPSQTDPCVSVPDVPRWHYESLSFGPLLLGPPTERALDGAMNALPA